MAFVNVSLLLGGLLTAIPIVLHLVMRQKPRRLMFPALQFLRARRETNRRRLQLKQWLLLGLRCVAILLLVGAFARPSVLSAVAGRWLIIAGVGLTLSGVLGINVVAVVQRKGKLLIAILAIVASGLLILLAILLIGTSRRATGVLLGDEQAPVAAVMIFDTSPHMEYRFQNQTRLEAARETGSWLIRQLPADSEVAVLDSRAAPAVFAVDLAAARKAIDRLRMTAVGERLPPIVTRALQLVTSSEKTRREIYVFTDLVESAWVDSAGVLSRALAQHPDVLLYVIDVGVVSPRNVGIGPLQLSAERLTQSSELRITTELRSLNSPGEQVLQLLLEESDPTLPMIVDGVTQLPPARPRAQENVSLESTDAQRVEFRLRGLGTGVQHGLVRLNGTDGLELDNVRYFTIEVQPAWPVLVVAPSNTTPELFTEAIAPREFQQAGQARFACTVVSPASLANLELETYAAVCLLDPEPIPAVIWERLGKYVRRGGGLAIFLGHNAQATSSFHEPAAQELLGGHLARVWRATDRELHVAPQRYDHPVMKPFRERATSVPWNASPVFRHWVLDPLADQASVVVTFSNGKPALVERSVGRGRVITMTTPVSDAWRTEGYPTWNELPTSDEAWPYVVLVNELTLYLTDHTATRLNYTVGETAVLTQDAREHPDRYQLFTPLEQPQEVPARDGEVVVRFTEHAGAYRLKGFRDGPIARGFAVNLSAESTDLTRLSQDELDQRLGPGRYQLARNQQEIELGVGEARVGREFYGHLLVLLVVVLGVEHLLANRFYRKNA